MRLPHMHTNSLYMDIPADISENPSKERRNSQMKMPYLLPRTLLSLFLLVTISQKSGGQLPAEWCVADGQVPDDELQKGLDWACGKGGADCSKIQVHQPCYLPNTVKDHASFAFNSYYQRFKNKGGSCYFNGAAMVTSQDPSHGPCKYDYLPDAQ